MRMLRSDYASLSPREREVMVLVVSGLPNKQIGGELGISEITVKAHRGRVMRKREAASLPHLVRMAAQLGLRHLRTKGDTAWAGINRAKPRASPLSAAHARSERSPRNRSLFVVLETGRKANKESSMNVGIDNVTVLGTGDLGSQIAYQTAYSGFEVMAYDINDQILETARKRFEELAARYEHEVEGASDGVRGRVGQNRIFVDSRGRGSRRRFGHRVGARAPGRQAGALREARAARA